MLIPSFTIQLNNSILKNLVTVGKFDGKAPSLACATSSDHIAIHSPHERNISNEHEVRQLSVNQRISAITCGDMKSDDGKVDSLMVGTLTNLLCYDVEHNSDRFYQDVQDGVLALLYGTIPSVPRPLVFAGGECSIQAFDHEGKDVFWTVTGDNVTSLAFRENPQFGSELMVGTEDCEIRVYQDETVVLEVTETEIITGLVQLQGNNYGFSLANGSIGVYEDETRIWHAKSKHNANAIEAFDLDEDGVKEFIGGWSNGRVEVRKLNDGSLIYKDRMPSEVAHICIADYRNDGNTSIVVSSVDGEVRGYLPKEDKPDTKTTGETLMDTNIHEQFLRNLFEKKQSLEKKLAKLENSMKHMKSGELGAGAIPPNTRINQSIQPSPQLHALLLNLHTNNETVIKLAMVFSDVLFEEGSFIVHPSRPASTLVIPLNPDKCQKTDLHIKVVVGHRSSKQDHVFEIVQQLPRFAPFRVVAHEEIKVRPTSYVEFQLEERVNRILLWMQSAFAFDHVASNRVPQIVRDSLIAEFVSIEKDEPLIISVTPENKGTIKIACNDMELAGDILQDMCKYLGVEDLASKAHFPEEMKAFGEVLEAVQEHNATRLKLSAEVADSSNAIKNMIIRAEDARINCNDMKSMSSQYQELYLENLRMIAEYEKRSTNHAALLESLKLVNQMIQKAARLRMGSHKAKVISACRQAIKNNNSDSLFSIISLGN